MPTLVAVMLIFLWEYDAKTIPPFLLTLESVSPITGRALFRVAGVIPSDCADLPTATSETYCMAINCPGPGLFHATVSANSRASNMLTVRVRDHDCRDIEGKTRNASMETWEMIPRATPCRKAILLPPPPVVTVEVPSMVDLPRTVATPRSTSPAIPFNPKVVAKVPHTTVPVPIQEPARVPAPTRLGIDPPPVRTVRVPVGPPEERDVPLPPPAPQGVPCP